MWAQELFRQEDRDFRACSWSTDGRLMLLESNVKGGTARSEIWLLDVATRKAPPLLTDPTASLSGPVSSPDGRYVSDESGTYEVYLRPYPALGRKWQISQSAVLRQSNSFAMAATTDLPHWRFDGKELMDISLAGTVDAAGIETEDGNLPDTWASAATYLQNLPTSCGFQAEAQSET